MKCCVVIDVVDFEFVFVVVFDVFEDVFDYCVGYVLFGLSVFCLCCRCNYDCVVF